MRLFAIALLVLLAADDPADAGRRGNALYESGRYAEAAEAFRAGLAAAAPDDVAARYGLLHNLGAALYRLEDYAAARQAMDAALALAAEAPDVARAAYNAGNTAFRQSETEAAVDRYKQALLADPDDENARFNYEVARRQMEQQQQQQQQGDGDGEQNPEDQNEQGEGQQDQQGDEEQEGDEQQENEQEQSGEDQQPGDEQGDEEEQPRPSDQPQNPDELSRRQAEQILQALENEEEQLLREVQKLKGRPRQVEKDW